MEGKITYTEKEVEKIISGYMESIMPAPRGFLWVATTRSYDGVDCNLKEIVKEKEGE